MHQKAQEALVTPSEYGYGKLQADLNAGAPIILKEASLCSKSIGYRGHLDILELKREDSAPPTYWLHITEMKRSYSNRNYILQAVAYAMILASPDTEIVFQYPDLRRPKKMRTVPLRLYPKGPFRLNVTVTLRTLKGGVRDYTRQFIVNSEPTEWGRGLMMAVMKTAKRLRSYHKPTIRFLEALPYCSYCKRDGNEECPMWTEICSRIPYVPLKKGRRLFLGKRKLLVSSKPHLALSAPLTVLESRNLMPTESETCS